MEGIQTEASPTKWTVVARYCSGNAWLLPRFVFAHSALEAQEKASRRFPSTWCNYRLTQVFVMPYQERYKGILVKESLYDKLPRFRQYRNHPSESVTGTRQKHRVRHVTGKR